MMDDNNKNNKWEINAKYVINELKSLDKRFIYLENNYKTLEGNIKLKQDDLTKSVNKIDREIGEIKVINRNICKKLDDINKRQNNFDQYQIINKVNDLEVWKNNISEIVSVSQLDKVINEDLVKLTHFKLKAVTVFISVQTIFAILFALLSLDLIKI